MKRIVPALSLLATACGPDGEDPTPAPSPYIDAIVAVEFGDGAGVGQDRMPAAVLGPPVGFGDYNGSTDVLALGVGGWIEVSFTDIAAVDRQGPDFTIFENPFYVAGDSENPYAEPAIVSVSDDGTTWLEFPCAYEAHPYTGCAGVAPVYSSPDNGISPLDPAVSGGDVFDLADVGLARARFVRIEDAGTGNAAVYAPSAGFDLDAIAVLNGEPIP